MKHKSETDTLNLPDDTIYIDTSIEYEKLKEKGIKFIINFCLNFIN